MARRPPSLVPSSIRGTDPRSRRGFLVAVAPLGAQQQQGTHDVAVRVHPSFRMNIHLDTDEANAASLREQGASGTIVEVSPPKA